MSVAYWMGGYNEGGFTWSSDPEKQFHYHPTMMSMGLVFLFGEAAIVYRVFRHEKKRFTKLLHLVIHSSALIFMFIALKAVWDSHDYHRASDGTLAPIPNLYSLHSWIGIITVVFYCLQVFLLLVIKKNMNFQYFIGFVTFFVPGMNMDIRKFSLPFHQIFGVILIIAVAATALMGISERAAWKHTCWTKHGTLCGQQLMANFLGLNIIGYTSCVVFIVMNPRWKRKPLPEEECLHPLSD